MSTDKFKVCGFSPNTLFDALSNPHASPEEVKADPQASYLYQYLKKLGTRSIVLEADYTDGDYLDDFASYYVKCFTEYSRRCKRLHFFKLPLTKPRFLRMVRGQLTRREQATLNQSYQGFVVARPLPEAIVGRTVLRTYESDGGRRQYECIRTYKANLFGLELTIPSLAFQEQDAVVAACATVSLWSCFQMTSVLFGNTSPTPAEITRAASKWVHPGRPFPSRGLNVVEICSAIRHVGLEPEVLRISGNTPLLSLVYGYLRMKVPVILGVEVEGLGLHAIAIAGYSVRKKRVWDREVTAPAYSEMKGLRIDALYGHDDQIGPFSKLAVRELSGSPGTSPRLYFESCWTNPTTGQKRRLFPLIVIVPIYNKIRLTFLDAQEWVTTLDHVLKSLCSAMFPGKSVEWDLHLMLSNEFKKSLRAPADNEDLESLLLRQHPRFIWRAALTVAGSKLVDLLFDATGIARSVPLYSAIWHHKEFAARVKMTLRGIRDPHLLLHRRRFWDSVINSI